MQLNSKLLTLNSNARFGSVALLLGGAGMSIAPWIEGAGPMRLLALGIMIFGQLCYAQEAGMEKPLTKLVLVTLAFASFGFILFELEGSSKAALLFAFAGFLTVVFWSVAMLHRPGKAQVTGKVGMLAGSASLAVLVGGHVFVGFGAAIGLGALRSVGTAQASELIGLIGIVAIFLGIWSMVCAGIIVCGLLIQQSGHTEG